MSKLKDLHLGTSLDDLTKLVALPDRINEKPIQALLKSAEQLSISITEQHAMGDEELTYVYLMKYFSLIQTVKAKPDYNKLKQVVNRALGGNAGWQRRMDLLERMNASLNRRYSEKANKSVVVQTTMELPPVSVSSSSYITCEQLYQKMADASISMMIMDCRPVDEYNESHIEYKFLVNIPEDLIQRGLSAYKLMQRLSSDAQAVWPMRITKNFVILIDDNTKESGSNRNPAIDILRDILLEWDQENTFDDSRHLLMVEGGYDNFALLYPMHVTNPGWKKPFEYHENINLDDIRYGEEYSSIDQIKMKDPEPTTPAAHGKPIVNRRTKPGALSKHSGEQQPRQSKFKARAELVKGLLAVTKTRMDEETELNRLIELSESDENLSPESRKKLISQRQQIQYNVIQLDDNLNDVMRQIGMVDQDIDVAVADRSEIDIIISTAEDLELQRQLELKSQDMHESNKRKMEMLAQREQRRRQGEYEREQQSIKKDRERKRAETEAAERARAAKAAQEKRAAQEEQKSRPPAMPLFDRTNKPKTVTVPKLITDRNFYPEIGSEGPGLTGLKNLGNTCYMNSVIQCLMNVDCLAEYLTKETYLKHIDRNSRTDGQIVEELAAVAQEIWSGRYRNITPRDLRFVIGEFKSAFAGYEQQDSHEFLTIFMDMLHLELQTIYEKSPMPLEKLRDSDRAWLEFTKQKESFFSKFFFGQIKSTVKCTVCGKESSTYESFSNLSLELPLNSNQCDIRDCLDLYFDGERVSEWNCPRCEQKRDAIKKLDISKLPPVLVIHFKRFYADFDSTKTSYKKKQTTIDFPLNNLDMSEYLSPVERKMNHATSYNLCGVSNHYGTMERGHYTAYCKNARKNRWYKFDDQVVTPMENSQVVSHAAYILFYSTI